MIGDDHSAELFKLSNDHHSDLAGVNRTWEETVRIIGRESDLKASILSDEHKANVDALKAKHAEEHKLILRRIEDLEAKLGAAEFNEAFASSTVTILRETLDSKETELTEAKETAAKEIGTLKEELGKKKDEVVKATEEVAKQSRTIEAIHPELVKLDEELVTTKREAARETKALKEELLKKDNEMKAVKQAAARALAETEANHKQEITTLLESKPEPPSQSAESKDDDGPIEGQAEGFTKSKNRRRRKNPRHDPARQVPILQNLLQQLHNSPRNNWAFAEDIDLEALVAILSTFVGESAYYRGAVQKA